MLKQKVMFLWFRKWRFGEAKQSVQGHMARMGDTAKTCPPYSVQPVHPVPCCLECDAFSRGRGLGRGPASGPA